MFILLQTENVKTICLMAPLAQWARVSKRTFHSESPSRLLIHWRIIDQSVGLEALGSVDSWNSLNAETRLLVIKLGWLFWNMNVLQFSSNKNSFSINCQESSRGFCLLVKVQIKAFVLWFCSSLAHWGGLFVFIKSGCHISDHRYYCRLDAFVRVNFCVLSKSRSNRSPQISEIEHFFPFCIHVSYSKYFYPHRK